MTAVDQHPLVDALRRRWSSPQPMLIGGAWVEAASGETFSTSDPATGRELAQVAAGDREDVDHAARAARAAMEGPWGSMSPSERGRLIWRLADLIEEHREELATIDSLDNGKPLRVALHGDLALAADMFRYMAGWPTKLEGATIPLSGIAAPRAQFLSYTLREPVGVVGQIIPWNFPMLMASWKLAPALAAGCAVVLKPAEQTPLSALRLGELICEAGFPDGVVNVVTGFGETAGAAIAAHERIDKVAFTGSTEIGRLIVKAATGNLKRVSLELGGKSPNVVFADAQLDGAIRGAASAIFFNQGEACSAGSRLYVQEPVFDEVVAGVAERARTIKLGPGLDPDVAMGPVISAEQRDRIEGYVRQGLADGATAAAGGSGDGSGEGWFVEPTVLVDVRDEMSVVREEIFGPVLTVQPFTDMDDLVAKANDSCYGLAAGVWTRDVGSAHRFARAVQAGSVWVNCYNVFDAALPFGGYKQSGWGREMGREVLEHYLETKAVTVAM